MAEQVFRNALVQWGQHDISGQANQVALAYGADAPEATAFNDDTHIMTAGGLKTVAFSVSGFWSAGAGGIDEIGFNNAGAQLPVLAAANDGSDSSLCYFFDAVDSQFNHGGSIGDLIPFSFAAVAAHNLVRGTVMHNATRTSTGNGVARQLGAVSSAQKLYAALFVSAASGTSPTLDVIVESDDNSGMTSATTRATFAQQTAAAGLWLTPVGGAVTDDWWRISYTIGGTSPSFSFVAALGIL